MNTIIKFLLLAVMFVQISACDLLGERSSVSGPQENQGGIAVPDPISKAMSAALVVAQLQAVVIVDGDLSNPKPMIVNNTGTAATLTIDNLTADTHTFQIIFSYDTLNAIGVVELAKSDEFSVNLNAGGNEISNSDFTFALSDDNNHGATNLADITDNDPMLDPKRCIVGFSTLADPSATPPIVGCRLAVVL